MNLSPEDSLRINVLLSQSLQAIRIDESRMIVYALSEKGEAKVSLHPDCRDEQYIKQVKEVISSHVLGLPGGYPIFLRRWARMGQARDESLERLLQLGEPEAIVAVVHAEGLTNELARRVWWAMSNSDNARCMLERDDVAKGDMGKVLADFLVEFLPFEEQPENIVNGVKLVLRPGLVSDDVRADLWKRGKQKVAYLVGFLKTLPDELPDQKSAHPQYEMFKTKLENIDDNVIAEQLLRCLGSAGQTCLKAIERVLNKPGNQGVAIAIMETLFEYFSCVRSDDFIPDEDIMVLQQRANSYCEKTSCPLSKQVQEVLCILPEATQWVNSMLVLAQMDVKLVNSIFARTRSVGTVMRKKLEPVFGPITRHIKVFSIKAG